MAEPASPRETVAARALGLTALTMLAFAGNSLLCRAALAGERIGPLSFTALRIAAGALVLGVLLRVFSSTHSEAEGPGLRAESGSWRGALALIAYALSFSVAYLSLDAGTGALVLFAAVQLTMMGASVLEGERPSLRVWLGSAVAIGGLTALLWPGVSAPDPLGAVLMGVAGVAWGFYSLFGRDAANPLAMTGGNFLRATPFALLAFALGLALSKAESLAMWQLDGVLLALASGGITSGLGYALWYRALRELTTTTAAVAQLSVPVIAAIGGTLWLGESLTPRLLIASAVTLSGIALVSTARRPKRD